MCKKIFKFFLLSNLITIIVSGSICVAENGTIKWFNPTKGYGFIQPDDGTQDVFVHIKELKRSGYFNLFEGQKVSFELATVKGKPSAVNIKVLPK